MQEARCQDQRPRAPSARPGRRAPRRGLLAHQSCRVRRAARQHGGSGGGDHGRVLGAIQIQVNELEAGRVRAGRVDGWEIEFCGHRDYRRPRGAHNSLLNLTVLEDAVGYKSTTTSVDRSDEDISIDLPQIKATRTTPMKPWWFGEKSGTLIFTVEETSSTSAVFALNVATRSLEKLADGVSNHTCCRRLYGYEMDRAALLASVAPQ